MGETPITYADFEKVHIRTGTVLRAEPFPEARNPALKLWIDFGELGVKQSSARITRRYRPGNLVGRQVLAVTNFRPLRVAGFKSEVLVLGVVTGDDDVVLLNIDARVPNGLRIS